MIKVVITEDHIIVRQGLRLLLGQSNDIEVVGEANNGKELLELLVEAPVDVVLMDINMPVMDGFEAISKVKESYPEVKVIALSMLNNISFVQKVMNSGASGFLTKSTGQQELHAAVNLVANGHRYICGELSVKMLSRDLSPDGLSGTMVDGKPELSKREIEVLLLIAEGLTNAEIADKLFTSKRTIETHRQNILEKTQAKNTANLIKYACEHKIIDLNQHD